MFKKLLLFGAGAVGSYFGAKLSKYYDITLVARGKRLDALQTAPLILKNADNASEEEYSMQALEKPEGLYDLIIITVKSHDTKTAAENCREHLKEDGLVLSIQNGTDNMSSLGAVFGRKRLICGVLYSGLSMPKPGLVLYKPQPSLKLASLSGSKEDEEKLCKFFSDAGLRCRLSENIGKDMWTKAAWNIAYNPLSALLLAKCGELRDDPHTNALMRSLIAETAQAAESEGVILAPDVIEQTLMLNPTYYDYKTSAYQDVEAGRRPEIDGLMGSVVAKAEAGLIDAPATLALYHLCKYQFEKWFHVFPRVAADVLVVNGDEVLLIERKYEPYGWAIPGGMVDYGEKVEDAAVRELEEETGISVSSDAIKLLGVYSDPKRDKRGHTASVVYYAYTSDRPCAGDDAAKAAFFPLSTLPELAFDHAKIISDYIEKVKK